MLSGGAAGLVSVETLRKEQEEIRRKEKQNKPLEGQLLFICISVFLPLVISVLLDNSIFFLLLFNIQRSPEMHRLCSETSQGGNGTLTLSDRSRAGRLVRRQRRMRNTLSGAKGEFAY